MILLQVWNIFRGYVIINVKGYFIEKFINLCINKGIYLWDIKKESSHSMVLKLSIVGFKSIRGIAKKTKCSVKIIKKVGIPFIKYKYRKRKSFAIGFLLFFSIVYLLSCFIWVIEINGINRIHPQQILNFLAQNGVQPAVLKYGFDKEALKTDMLLNISELSWVEINFIGTKVVVNTVERVPQPEIIDRTTPCNIFAKKNGVIKNLVVKNGTGIVKEGSVVKKGQLLVSGIIENRLNPIDIRYVHADGIVKAFTWYEETAKMDIIQQKKELAGEYKIGYQLKVFSDYFNIYNPKLTYENYDTEEKLIRLSLWKNYELPVELVIKKYYKVNYNQYTITEDAVKEACKKEAFEKAVQSLPPGVEETDRRIEYQYANNNQTIIARATIECIEDIGQKQAITKE